MMTEDIAQLRNLPLYFYGQQFMGPVESYILAPFVRIFGSFYLWVRFWNELFYLGFMAGAVWVSRRLFDKELKAWVLLLAAACPFPVLFYTTIVGYGEILFLAVLSLILLIQLSSRSVGGYALAMILGLVSGLAMWCNAIFTVWLVPIGLSLVFLIPLSWRRRLPLGFLLGFFLGLIPAWISGLLSGTPMNIHAASKPINSIHHVPAHFFIFFARLKNFLTPHLSRAAWLPFLCFGISWVHLLFSGKTSFDSPKKVWRNFILIPPVLLAGLYVSRDLGWDEGIRYFLPLWVSFVFATAWWLRSLTSFFWKQTILALISSILLLSSLLSLRMQADLTAKYRELLYFLDSQQLHYGVGDLYASYGMNAMSRGRILMSPARFETRSQRLWQTVKENHPNFFVFEKVGHRFRERLESDPKIKHISLAIRDVYYGPADIFSEILESRERIDLTGDPI